MNTTPSTILKTRNEFCARRLADLRERVAKVEALKKAPKLSIYVTGSYGRLEASEHSDLDLFFISAGEKPGGRITKTLIDAELIKIIKDMGFPPFSNSGQYLGIHSLTEMLETLGGREDDFKNFFTARLLLLLESRPVFDDHT